MKTIGITGGSGLIGTHITRLLISKGYRVVILSRSPKPGSRNGVIEALFDAASGKSDREAISQLDAAMHLAGEPVAGKRWTAAQKDKIYSSRVEGTRFLVEQLRSHAPGCKTLISASAIGYYGPDNAAKTPFTEADTPADDFLGKTCRAWEAASHSADSFARVVLLRTGIVLAREGGAFKEFVRTLPMRVLPVLGTGEQMISWIHVDDMAAIYVHALENETMNGPYNAAAPTPISNKQLMQTIAGVHGGFHLMPKVPAFALRAALGEMSVEVLKSCTVNAKHLADSGFRFRYETPESAVRALLQTTG